MFFQAAMERNLKVRLLKMRKTLKTFNMIMSDRTIIYLEGPASCMF